MQPVPLDIGGYSAGRGWGWGRIAALVSSTALAVTGAVVRALDFDSVSNGLSDLAIGAGVQGVVYSVVPDINNKVHKVCMTLFGQIPLFAATQVVFNTENPVAQAVSTSAITAMLGAHLVSTVVRLHGDRWVMLHPFPARLLPKGSGQQFRSFKHLFLSSFGRRAFSVLGSIFCAAIAIGFEEEVARQLLAFLSAHYGAYFLGGLAEVFYARKIVSLDSQQELQLLEFRVNCLVALYFFIAFPLLLTPWDAQAHTSARIAQLPFLGLGTGGIEGFSGAFIRRRWQQASIDQIPALQSHSSECHRAFCQWSRHFKRVSALGVTGFVAWQVFFDLPDLPDKLVLTAFWTSFMGALGISHFADQWNLSQNQQVPTTWKETLRDRAICWLTTGGKILGVSPAVLAMVISNATTLNDKDITKQSLLRQIISGIGWSCYGIAMGSSELFEGVSLRKFEDWRRVLFTANTVLSTQRLLLGEL